MNNFKLQQEGMTNSTSIPNNFIENYMPTAAGEFVKIYIYLLKCVNENCSELSISRISDVFNNTEKDTTRALKYWEKKGLLKLSFDENGILTSLVLTSASLTEETKVTKSAPAPEKEPEAPIAAAGLSEEAADEYTPKQYSRNELAAFKDSEDNNMLIFVVQKLIGRRMTGNDINAIMFMEDSLGFNGELIEYLFEYCADKKKTSIRYIEKTAIEWAKQGIKDVKSAKLLNAIYSENCYPVMKAYGLTGRNPAQVECDFINRWVISYGFGLDMILEAVGKTMTNIHKPSFEYTDALLKDWKAHKITTLEDVKCADKEFEAKKITKKNAASGKINKEKKVNTSFNSFEQRSYDYELLEELLVNK